MRFNILLASGLTQSEFAAKSGITQPALSMYVSGDRTPSIDVLLKISKAFKISIEDILAINAAPSLSEAAIAFLTAQLKNFSAKQINGLANFIG
jgi:transcriptional regulator with XRE-family HTH domain